jgi:hypothetical protein
MLNGACRRKLHMSFGLIDVEGSGKRSVPLLYIIVVLQFNTIVLLLLCTPSLSVGVHCNYKIVT